MTLNQTALINNIHLIMRSDPFINALFKGVGGSLDDLNKYIEDVVNQIDIDSATWGLDLYEKELGVRWNNKPYEERRAGIKARWRSSGKADIYLIQQVADAWKNGQVAIDFKEDGKIHMTFDGEYGVPSDLEGLISALDEVKPAHLELVYNFMYLLIKDIHGVMKVKDLEKQKINAFAFELGGNKK